MLRACAAAVFNTGTCPSSSAAKAAAGATRGCRQPAQGRRRALIHTHWQNALVFESAAAPRRHGSAGSQPSAAGTPHRRPYCRQSHGPSGCLLGSLPQDGQHLARVVCQPDGHHRHGVGNVQVVDLQRGLVVCGAARRGGTGGGTTMAACTEAGQSGILPERSRRARQVWSSWRRRAGRGRDRVELGGARSPRHMSRTRWRYTASPLSSVKVRSRRAKRRATSRCTGSCAIHSRMGPRASSRLISTSPCSPGGRRACTRARHDSAVRPQAKARAPTVLAHLKVAKLM